MTKLKSAIIEGIRNFTERKTNELTMADFIENEISKEIDSLFYDELSEIHSRLKRIETLTETAVQELQSWEQQDSGEFLN